MYFHNSLIDLNDIWQNDASWHSRPIAVH